MIETSTYLWTVGSLIMIIGLFVAYYLREPRVKSMTFELKKQLSNLQKEQKETTTINANLETKTNEQQKTISEQTAKLSIPAKFTFDPLIGCLVSISENKRYCTACLLKFKESPLGIKGNPLICPECKTDYNGPPRWTAVHQLPPDDPFSRIR